MRGRGLKRLVNGVDSGAVRVASRAGAWIETPLSRKPSAFGMSPPVRGRGLKQLERADLGAAGSVASRAGAWIETICLIVSTTKNTMSPPVRGRGLKLFPHAVAEATVECRLPCGGVD